MNHLPAASYGVSRYCVTKTPQGAGNEPQWRDALITGARSGRIQRHAGSNSGNLLLAAYGDGVILGNVFQLTRDLQITEIDMENEINDIALSINGRYFLTAAYGPYTYSSDALFCVYDYDTGEIFHRIPMKGKRPCLLLHITPPYPQVVTKSPLSTLMKI